MTLNEMRKAFNQLDIGDSFSTSMQAFMNDMGDVFPGIKLFTLQNLSHELECTGLPDERALVIKSIDIDRIYIKKTPGKNQFFTTICAIDPTCHYTYSTAPVIP